MLESALRAASQRVLAEVFTLTDPEVISDRERYAEVGRAYSQLEAAAKLAAQWRHAQPGSD